MFRPGESIDGRFDVVGVLGSGGFATVLKVFDKLEQQFWAMKIFARTSAEDALRREIRCLRSIQHPNVLSVVWADRTEDGHWYLLSEFLAGDTLDLYTGEEQRLPDAAIVELGTSLLRALEAIHPNVQRIRELESSTLSQAEWDELQELKESGFVHRDIKPQNLMLTPEGLKLLDFNIASRVGDPVYTISGTPAYQPPDSDLTKWSESVDLFAAGVTLYELFCHEHPYPDAQPSLEDGPLDPIEFREELSAPIRHFLLKACAPTASERFQAASEMLVALEACADVQHQGLAHPVEVSSSTSAKDRRHEANPGETDIVEVTSSEMAALQKIGAGWPAVLSCNRDREVWATFGERTELQGEISLLDVVVRIVTRERPAGGRFQLSDEGVYVWALERFVAKFEIR